MNPFDELCDNDGDDNESVTSGNKPESSDAGFHESLDQHQQTQSKSQSLNPFDWD
ncbi:unnamed protein product [Trichobilharzia regenti]|nr:unnamed protein product [Trichobilharzia regenti]